MTDKTPAVHEALAVYAPETVETDRVPPGYKQTEVGVIPEDWEVKAVYEIATVSSGGTPSRSNLAYWEGNIPWATTAQINFNEISTFEQFITEDGLRNSAAKMFPAGTLLVAMYGQGKTRGKIGILGVEATTNQACAAIVLDKNISQDYVFQYLGSQYQSIRKLSNTGNQENLNGHLVKSIQVPVPPLHEQRAIAAALSDVDALISGLDKLIAKKRAVKTAAMQQLLIGKQRLPGFSGEWEAKRFGDVVERIVGGGTPSRSNPAYWGGEIPWMTVKDFANFDPYRAQETITEEGLKHSASHLIPKGIIIMSTRMALGKAVIYEVDVSINQDLKAIFPKRDMDSRFLYFWFEHHAEMIESLGSGSTVKGISLQDLRRVKFLKAPLKEQRAIAAVLSDMDAEIGALEGRREKTRRIKQAMMQELLTGRTRLV